MTTFSVVIMNFIVMVLAILATVSLFPKRDQFGWFSHVENHISIKGWYRIPRNTDTFEKALYTFTMGQRDFTLNLTTSGVQGAKRSFPKTVSIIDYKIKEVYGLGGRTLLVMNLAPVGCFPRFLVEFPHGSSDLDAFGCLIPINDAVREYNELLKETVSKTRQELVGATVVYVDTHSVILDMFQHPESHGMKYGTRACCGYGGGAYNYHPVVKCGQVHLINGHPAAATACNDPGNYVSWDGFSLTEAAERVLADAVLNGSWSDPPFPLRNSVTSKKPRIRLPFL